MDVGGVRLLLGMIHLFFDIIKKVCGDRMTKLTDLKTDNIGVDENNRVVLLDVESASVLAHDLSSVDWDSGQKSRARVGVKTFFARLSMHGEMSKQIHLGGGV